MTMATSHKHALILMLFAMLPNAYIIMDRVFMFGANPDLDKRRLPVHRIISTFASSEPLRSYPWPPIVV